MPAREKIDSQPDETDSAQEIGNRKQEGNREVERKQPQGRANRQEQICTTWEYFRAYSCHAEQRGTDQKDRRAQRQHISHRESPQVMPGCHTGCAGHQHEDGSAVHDAAKDGHHKACEAEFAG